MLLEGFCTDRIGKATSESRRDSTGLAMWFPEQKEMHRHDLRSKADSGKVLVTSYCVCLANHW